MFLRELCVWLDANRFGKKVLFVRNVTVGNQLLRMAADHGTPAVNVVAMPVRSYMEHLAEGEMVARGLQKIDVVTASIELQRIMRELGGTTFTTMGQVELTTASRMLPQLEELEQNGIEPAALASVGQPLLGQVWEAFLSWKKENGYVSEAELRELASVPEGIRFAILSNVQLDKTEQDFLSGIPTERLTVIHVAVPEGMTQLRNAVFSAPGEESGVDVEKVYEKVSCFDCQDIDTEIRAALQYLIEKRIPAEDAVIVCPNDEYGMRTVNEGKLLGVPVDSAFGKPASMTDAALLLRCMQFFAERHYDVEALTPALISGSMAVYVGKKERKMKGLEMLRAFRKERVGWSKERWQRMCSDEKANYALAASSVYAWVCFFERESRPVRSIASELIELIHGSLRQGDEYELYLRIADEMSRIYPGDMIGVDFLKIMREIADEQKVGAHTADRPGHVYCCSYENAMYVNRKHFWMLGMSWDAFNRLGNEFPLLHDEEKASLSKERLRLVGDRAYEKRYAVRELIANREDASLIFSRARMDYIGGEEIMAAGIFDDAAQKYKQWNEEKKEYEIHVPQVNILNRKALTESDVRLRSGYEPLESVFDADEGRSERWKKEFNARNWSATMLETAASCPRWFTFKTQMGLKDEDPTAVPRRGQNWLDSISMGNIVHEILEAYFREIKPRIDTENDVLLDRLIQEKVEKYKQIVPVPENFSNPSLLQPEIDKIGKMARKAIREHVKDKGRETIDTESIFGMNDEKVFLEFGPYRIRVNGKIDRVDRTPDGYEIIDYKTNNPFYFKKELDDKLQHYLYTVAWEKLHPEVKVVRASYVMLEGTARPIDIDMTETVRSEMNRKMEKLLETLSDPDTALTPAFEVEKPNGEKGSCSKNCPFLELCEGTIGEMLDGEMEPAEDETEE